MRSLTKVCLSLLSLALPAIALGHGPVASQMATAVQRSVEIFLKDEPRSVQEALTSITASLTGEETFQVEMKLQDGKGLSYRCGLDKLARPVKWGCKKVETSL